MAEPLKNEFNASFVAQLGSQLSDKDSSFRLEAFVAAVLDEEWEGRELKNRMRHLTCMIRSHTALVFLDQLEVMKSLAVHYSGLQGMTFPDFVEVYGQEYLAESLVAMKHMTQYSTAEFAIRPFIIKYEKEVMNTLLDWSMDANEHVRRLSSEGCRPRLPWAMALPAFKKDPKLILPILENLKADDSLYVRKSVANNLNDITKDHVALALDLGERWYGDCTHTNWVVKHGLRNLLKQGHPRALQVIGFDDKAKFSVPVCSLSERKLKIGDVLHFEFEVVSEEAQLAFAKVGFVVSYQKANGTLSDKIFHVAEKEFDRGSSFWFKKKLSFKDLSTRKHYLGRHKLGILVNGKKLTDEVFELV
ncbi:DNA alkylation repair protein [Reichenbachiella carrageenanivorans]|uniref:DNA alkylation repair protein n=1 Tax=Reichenbachiella carrageenanivorans TaxID=2979869 RepID=A0ABY6CV20_9BACT|nr:DNA alkylation repair protein [Reichenbachiella carrageenanivorans]UXX77771.1 DNA alkylation repair protein [Reichenbachiella carrageenanivorans]